MLVLLLAIWVSVVGYGQMAMPYINSLGVQAGNDYFNQVLESKLPQDYLQDIFDKDGQPLMDYLFIVPEMDDVLCALLNQAFGTDYYAVTEDYVFVFCAEGREYKAYSSVFKASNSNFPLLTLLKRIGGNESLDKLKLYFTGTVHNAYAGGKECEGFFELEGGDGETVDVYMRDFAVLSVQNKTLTIDLNQLFAGGLVGMAAPFAIKTTGGNKANPLTVRFHVKGENKLVGGAVTELKLRDMQGTEGMIVGMLLSLLKMSASPVALRPIGGEFGLDWLSTRTGQIVFDDYWTDAQRTNGSLDLFVDNSGREAPSVNLGNAYGSCIFNGGVYGLTTAVSNSMFYVSSMSICYRMIELMGMRFYGVGTSVSTPESDHTIDYNVWIKDGTFYTHSADDCKDVLDVVGHGWYADYSDLRLPIKTIVDGGSFANCEVYACDASAEQGVSATNSNKEALCRIPVVVADYQEGQGYATNVVLNDKYANYGKEALMPMKEKDDTYVVYPLLPTGACGQNTAGQHVYNWVSVIPLMGVKMEAVELTMGGDVEVLTVDPSSQILRKNSYLFYTRLNDYTKSYASVNIMGIDVRVEQAIRLAGDDEYTQVLNETQYTIEHGLYTMLSFESNKWYTITPPYDVHNVYVLETLPDEALAENGLTEKDKGTERYLQIQGEKDGILAQGIVTSLLPDILSGKGSGVGMNLMDICEKTLHLPSYKLTYYNPDLPNHGADKANYELRELVDAGDEDFYGIWSIENSVDDYSQKWKFVTDKEPSQSYVLQDGSLVENASVIMQKGHVYSLFLPSGNDKYWDGKYLVFEGYGPQTIDGTEMFKEPKNGSNWEPYYWIQDYAESDKVYLQGNATFGRYEPTEQIFVPDTDRGSKHDFVRKEGIPVLPWETYMVMSTDNTIQYSSLSALCNAQSAIQQDAPEQMGLSESAMANQCPRVADKSLIVYNGEKGITLQAFEQQTIRVYTIGGILVWSGKMYDGDVRVLPVEAGVYIIQGEQETIKLITNGRN
ncbi:MAG: hypothetical protein NC038_04195 [Paludibacter sp.]|nr:hypothetical protein [Bacteroidales bacterium]MCM1069423.1 hypothetical protein [Prevotella sp.]MCM1353798.1 hypothetical protein [Bacteroides sp.]MCM1442801.1 hypothetical protein [Muribaculum sp.]MCM1481833.1 hypothetical protein [Paludibacter sp.]